MYDLRYYLGERIHYYCERCDKDINQDPEFISSCHVDKY